MSIVAGAPSLSELASAINVRSEEAAIVAELKAGSEAAFSWLIANYSQPVYSLVYRVLDDPSDAADTTQEVFIKVFRGIKSFHSNASLKTWIYRIALHEACNQRRWWFRHRGRETTIEPSANSHDGNCSPGLKDLLVDGASSPLDNIYNQELRACVESELKSVAEPFRSTIILRDLEELSYEEIAEVMEVSLGTVKSRLVRGREALRKGLGRHLPAFGVDAPDTRASKRRSDRATGGQKAEVMP
ncbi:MAG: sigma-70 family RNA polymerase sigma factor [Candidatus Korobacteraceae bacterium]